MSSDDRALGEVAAITMGTSPKSDSYNRDGIGLPLLNGPTEFGIFHPSCTLFTTDSKRECKRDDLLFCVRGSTTGRMNWADQKYSLGRGVCAIRGQTILDTRFIKYCLEHKLNALLKVASGGTFPNLGRDALSTLSIPYPAQRHRIAIVLSAYDDLVENNTDRIATLEEMARTLYWEWFVQFRFPGYSDIEVMESSMGPIPKGWKLTKITDAVDVNPKVRVPQQGLKPFVAMKNLSESWMLITEFEQRTGNSGSKFRNGDTLFARITPSLENGKTGFVQFLPSDSEVGFGSTEFIVLRSRTLAPEYVYLLARTNEFRDHAIKSMTGATGRQRVQESCFDEFYIAHPDRNTLQRFVDQVSPVFRSIHLLAKKNDVLRRTRNFLLPRLISGELDVSELAIETEKLDG